MPGIFDFAVMVFYLVCGERTTFDAHITLGADGVCRWITPWTELIHYMMCMLNRKWGRPDLSKVKKVFAILTRKNPRTGQEEIFVTVDTRYDMQAGYRIDGDHGAYELSFTGGGLERIMKKHKRGHAASFETVRDAMVAEVAEETGIPFSADRDIVLKCDPVHINSQAIAVIWHITDEYGERLERASGIVPRAPVLRQGKPVVMNGVPLVEVPEQHARAWVPVSRLLDQSVSNGRLSICEGAPAVRQRMVMLKFLNMIAKNVKMECVGDPAALGKVHDAVCRELPDIKDDLSGLFTRFNKK